MHCRVAISFALLLLFVVGESGGAFIISSRPQPSSNPSSKKTSHRIGIGRRHRHHLPPPSTAVLLLRSQLPRPNTSCSTSALLSSSTSTADTQTAIMTAKRPFRIRTITSFVTLHADDFQKNDGQLLATKIEKCNDTLRKLESSLTDAGYEVQTVRVATNPFGEWLTQNNNSDDESLPPMQKRARTDDSDDNTPDTIQGRLQRLDNLLEVKNIQFCSLGPSKNLQHTIDICPTIVAASGKFSCSADIQAGDIEGARAAAKCMQTISTLGEDEDDDEDNMKEGANRLKGGLGNFRFCAASCVETVPFFPGAKAPSSEEDEVSFAIGLENGGFACKLLSEAKNIGNIKNIFDTKMREELMPIQDICLKYAESAEHPVKYLGIDTSLNPSLDDGGSVADAIECLEEVRGDFGGTGSLAAAAAITTSLQTIPDITTTGYCGLMLPVLEDQRLAELGMVSNSSADRLTIQKLLCISSVCGVGIDTVPIPGNVSNDHLSSLILDVAALAGRWNKPLSCRVFPVPGGSAGEKTTFDSPYMCNSCIFDL